MRLKNSLHGIYILAMNYINSTFYGHYHNRIRKGYSGHLNLDHSFSRNDRLASGIFNVDYKKNFDDSDR